MGLLEPDEYFTAVSTIDFTELKQRGIRGLILDLDNTLLAHKTMEMSAAVLEWAEAIREQGFSVALVSNNWGSGRVQKAAERLGFEVVGKALKPLPFAFKRAMRLMGTSPSETAVIGDQLFTDVLGGNLAGALTVLVQPLDPWDMPHTLVLRAMERRLLAGRKPTA